LEKWIGVGTYWWTYFVDATYDYRCANDVLRGR
jgi:hypothetical protein